MNKYYVGQKLLYITNEIHHSFFSLNQIYEVLSIKEEEDITWIHLQSDRDLDSWNSKYLDRIMIDATKYLSEQEFNTKFDDWLNDV